MDRAQITFAGTSLSDPGRPEGPTLSQARRAFEMRDLTLLDGFDAHELKDLDNASLMDRVDTKFLMPRALLADLLRAMRERYSVLEIDGTRSFRYRNDYFDDPTHRFYRAHHAGRMNRFKVRRRDYLDNGTAFLELKRKNNRGRTLKTRVPTEPGDAALSRAATDLLLAGGVTEPHALGIVHTGTYRRLALASEARAERLTIDCDLRFRSAVDDRGLELGPWVLAELKQARHDRASPFFRWARDRGLRPCGFSKYCMGMYLSGPEELRRNRFHGVARLVGRRR